MSSLAQRFKQRLKDIIEAGTVSQIELHRKTGLSRSVIYSYLEKDTVPDLNSLNKIAEALECDPVDLIKPIEAKSNDAEVLLERLKGVITTHLGADTLKILISLPDEDRKIALKTFNLILEGIKATNLKNS